jgi:hypothetical protein
MTTCLLVCPRKAADIMNKMAENVYAHTSGVMHLGDACNNTFDVMFLGFGGLCGGIVSWYSKYWYLPSIHTFPTFYGKLNMCLTVPRHRRLSDKECLYKYASSDILEAEIAAIDKTIHATESRLAKGK